MCGLCGMALNDPGARVSRDSLQGMASTLTHRGPDDGGVLTEGPFGLAFRRLSIIDVEGGHQPLSNEDGKVWVVMNGEIYNHRALRADLEQRGHQFATGSDAEVLVHLWEEYGTGLTEQLVGMYAFALVDLREAPGRLLLARDRLGIKPLYWSFDGEALLFASEPKAILEAGRTARELRPEALLDYLVQGYVGGQNAAWRDIQRLEPSGVLEWSPGQEPRSRRTWDLVTDGLREEAEEGEILEWVDRVVGERLIADVPLGAFLSGGIDSSAVVDSMARAGEERLDVCSVGFHEKSHDELSLARETARRRGLRLHSRILAADPKAAVEQLPWFFDEPLADPSTLPTWLVSGMAREHVTVALSGDGGDETFAGYRRYVFDLAENRLRDRMGGLGCAAARRLGAIWPPMPWAPRFLRGRTFLANLGDDPARAYWRSVTRMERGEALALLHPDLVARIADHDPFHAFEEHYRRPTIDDPLYRAQYADFHTWLPDQILTKVDRASMAVSLEVRVPLLDHRFVERFAHLPASQKVRRGRGKHALREALRGRIREEVLDGAKRGFDTPLAEWSRGPLAEVVEEAVVQLPSDWFRPAALQRILAEHRARRRDHGRLLWSLLVLEHWRRRHGVIGLAP